MKLKRPLYGQQDPRGPSHGRDVVAVKRGLWKVETDFFPRPPTGFDDIYNARTSDAVAMFQSISDIPSSGIFRQPTLDALEPYMDAYARFMYRTYRPPSSMPRLGPVWDGGQSILVHDLTHTTDGIPLYPAFDDAFVTGRAIIAPEDLEVIEPYTSANPGSAFYARGVSKIRFWFGHLDRHHVPGTRFRRGDLVGRVAPNGIGGGPHVHVGINVELLLGKSVELIHRTDYRHGAPLVGDQLRKAFS